MASGHRCPRGREGARPGPGLMRAERGNPVRVRRAGAGMRRQGGRPTVRGAEFPGRTGCPGSGCRAAERRQESGAAGPGTPPGWLSYNWPGCRILLSGLERALTWAGEPLRRERAYVPELMGKLDTSVNGPEGLPPFDGDAWERTDWRHHEGQVRRLRGRIFKAVQEGDWPSARNVQKLLLRSWSNTLVSVRQVTQRNTGRATAGIDGLVALTSQARAEMAVQVHASIGSHQPSPVRRVYVPKASDKTRMRPLGIPVLIDRCHQARVKNALEPEWEARFEPRSYGFRPGRGCHDAIESLFSTLRWKGKRVWILDADLAAALDACSHCSFCSLWWSEQPVLEGWGFDTQAFPASGADVDGAEPSVFDTLHDGLAGDAVGEGGFEHGEPAVRGVVDEQGADFGSEADPPGGAGGELLAGDEPVAEPAVQGGGGEAEFGGGVGHGEQFSFLRVVAWLVAGDAPVVPQALDLTGGV